LHKQAKRAQQANLLKQAERVQQATNKQAFDGVEQHVRFTTQHVS
jgi:hypothetical protein